MPTQPSEAVGSMGRMRSEAAELAIDSEMRNTAYDAAVRQYRAGQRRLGFMSAKEHDAIQETLKERENRLARSKPRRGFALGDRLRVVESLLHRKADPIAMQLDGRTPLHYAALNNYLEILESLLQHKADPNAMDHEGSTPLHEAAMAGHLEVVESLLKIKADPNAMDKRRPHAPSRR